MPKVKNLPENIYRPEALRKPRILHSGHLLLFGIITSWMILLLTTHLFAEAMAFSGSLYGPKEANDMAPYLSILWKGLLVAAALSIPGGYYIAQQPKTEPARFYIGLGLFCAPLAAIVWAYAQPVKYPFFQYAFWAYLYHDAPELQSALVESLLTAVGVAAASLIPVWLAFGRVEWTLSEAFGSASWGDGLWFAQGPPQTRLGKKLSRAEDTGFPIGWKDDRMLYDRSGLHKLVVAPTGAGKSTGFVIPALLTHQGSAFVIDIKRELYHVTARRRHEINGSVHRLDPFGDNTAQYNPLDLIDTSIGNDRTALDDARRISHMLVIETGKESNPFFPRSARQMVTGLILYVAAHHAHEEPEKRHLGTVRDLLMRTDGDLREVFKETMGGKAPSFDGWEECGESVLRQINEKGNQFAGMDSREFTAVLATAREQTAFLASTPVRQTLMDTTVSFADMKAKERGATFYIVLPEERLETYSRWLRLMIVSAMTETLRVQGKPEHSVLFMIDEFPALKRFDELAGGLARHRSAGIQYVLVCQSDNQIKEHYRDTADSIRGNTQCQFMWAPNTRQAQEMISNRAGKMTVAVEGATQNMSRSHGGREGSNKSVSRSIQERERPLVTPDEAGRLPSEYAFVFTRHQKPLVIRRPNYVTDELFKQHADPHPNYSTEAEFKKAQGYRKRHGIGFVDDSPIGGGGAGPKDGSAAADEVDEAVIAEPAWSDKAPSERSTAHQKTGEGEDRDGEARDGAARKRDDGEEASGEEGSGRKDSRGDAGAQGAPAPHIANLARWHEPFDPSWRTQSDFGLDRPSGLRVESVSSAPGEDSAASATSEGASTERTSTEGGMAESATAESATANGAAAQAAQGTSSKSNEQDKGRRRPERKRRDREKPRGGPARGGEGQGEGGPAGGAERPGAAAEARPTPGHPGSGTAADPERVAIGAVIPENPSAGTYPDALQPPDPAGMVQATGEPPLSPGFSTARGGSRRRYALDGDALGADGPDEDTSRGFDQYYQECRASEQDQDVSSQSEIQGEQSPSRSSGSTIERS